MQVHRGVYEAAKLLYERFRPMVEEHLASSPFAKITFVGHSWAGRSARCSCSCSCTGVCSRCPPSARPTPSARPPSSARPLGPAASPRCPQQGLSPPDLALAAAPQAAPARCARLFRPFRLWSWRCSHRGKKCSSVPACCGLFLPSTGVPRLQCGMKPAWRPEELSVSVTAVRRWHLPAPGAPTSSGSIRGPLPAGAFLPPEEAARTLLERLGLPPGAIRNVIMHRDIVPRAFACDYTLVADLLARVGGRFPRARLPAEPAWPPGALPSLDAVE